MARQLRRWSEIMPPQLMALTDGPNILLDKPILLVGRHQECDIQIPSRKISRRHCCIAQVNDHLVVRDLCSTNGIRINGVRVAEGSLKQGDELTIGNYRYEVRWNGQAAEEAGPAAKEVKPALPRPFKDNPFESWDQPMPLQETPGVAVPLAPGVGPPPETKKTPQPMPGANGPSLHLPENLELAPSGEFPPPQAPPAH
jgi:pSer/pThr/pTyr-binding forkhead associated (FHA) protein